MAEQEVQLPKEYHERLERFNKAVSLEKPDRVPVASLAGFFIARYGGLTHKEAMYDYDKLAAAWLKATKELKLDLAPPPFVMFPGPVMELLGLKTFKWPGYDLNDMAPYQFVEDEYMQADEYDEFLRDPGDFTVRKLWPRMSNTLKPLGAVPPLHWMSSGYTLIMLFSTLAGNPELQEMFKNIIAIGDEMNKCNQMNAKLAQGLASDGYPLITGSFTEAPFDWISDMFRGLKGAMLDMYRRPDKLKAAMEVITPFMIHSAMGLAQQSGNKRIFIPLHRGAGGFMSNKQFEEFYWPGLKKMMLAFIDAGLTPMPFLEGDYTPRLDYLAELPKGKVLGHFDVVDLDEAKKKIGGNMCFWGNVPAQLLVTGKPEQTKDYVKKLIDTFADTGGLIVDGSVDGIPPESKFENVEAMVDTVYTYGKYS